MENNLSNMKNNLFYWATGELSQDAFICWLMSYAMKDSKEDAVIKACAQEFLWMFIKKSSSEDKSNIGPSDIVVDKIERQVTVNEEKKQKKRGAIDVLLTVSTPKDKYKIIIEDKTYTSEHDDQLQFYKNAITDKFQEYTFLGVYYKIGFQSDYEAVKEAGYCRIGRAEIVECLKKYEDKTTNVIFNDYYEYLKDLHKKAKQFESLPLQEWDWQQIYGFYEYLLKEEFIAKYGFCKSDFDYVSNPSGGFDGFWTSKKECHVYNSDQSSVKYEMYLLLQFCNGKTDKENLRDSSLKISLKVNVSDIKNLKLSDFVNELIYDESGQYRLKLYNYGKPDRLRAGKNMTLGIYDKKNKADKKYENYNQVMDDLEGAMQGFAKMTEAICIGEKCSE